MKMRNALPLLALICFTGCEAIIPSGKALPKPPVVVTPTKDAQRIELVIRVDGEGRIKLDGNSTIGITSDSVRLNRCVCGADCASLTNPAQGIETGMPTSVDATELRQDADPSSSRRRAEKPIVRLYAPDWCQYCKPVEAAFALRKDLPFEFVVVRGETPAAQSYPWITWTRSDGVVMNFDSYTWLGVDNVINGWRANQ
jgi:hypothetical protein